MGYSPPSPCPSPFMTTPASAPATPKPGLHPRNRHRSGYDFPSLIAAMPGLARHVVTTLAGTPSIDFADPEAVKRLNCALLAVDYGVQGWDIPPHYLCPPIPGRADVLHHLADLLAEGNDGNVPRGDRIFALDIGVGANGVYPLIGHAEYGWRFVGVDTDARALENLGRIVAANPGMARALELRHQPVADNVFVGVLRSGEKFDVTLCNPPFHASPAEAMTAAARKWKSLGKAGRDEPGTRRNFGGQSNELWYPGGERAFLTRLIEQSATIPKRCLWFSTLVSKAENVRYLEAVLAKLHPCATKIIPMAQGQKQSRLLVWTFTPKAERLKWRRARWERQPSGAPSAKV